MFLYVRVEILEEIIPPSCYEKHFPHNGYYLTTFRYIRSAG